MYRIRKFIRRLMGTGTEPVAQPAPEQPSEDQRSATQPSPAPPSEAREPAAQAVAERPSQDQERIARVVVERLSEDETLRGDLTDAGFGPILTFVTSRVPDAALRVTEQPAAPSAEDEVSRAARALTRAIVAMAETGDAALLQGCLGPPMLSEEEAARAQQAMSMGFDTEESPDQRAERTINALRTAIQEPGP